MKTFAMPFDWPNVPPLFSASMLQQAWTRTHDSQLIASNLYEAGGGSGIFSRGEVMTFVSGSTDDILATAHLFPYVSSISPEEHSKQLHMRHSDSLEMFEIYHESTRKSRRKRSLLRKP